MARFASLGDSIGRVLRNLAANVVGQLMNGVYQIVLVPLFLHYWNKESYGEWLVLFSIPSLLWSLEGGLSGVAANRMTLASGSGDWEKVNAIFQNVLFAQTLFTAAAVGVFAFVDGSVDLQGFFHFHSIHAGEIPPILALFLCYMLIGFYLSLFRAIYRATMQEHRGIMVNNLWRLADFLVTVAVLSSHHHALTLAWAIMLCALGWTLLVLIDVRRKCPQVQFGFRRVSWRVSKGIAIDGAPLLASQAASALSLQGYPLIINRFLGPGAVVAFVTVRTLSRSILLLNQVICLSSAPEVSRSFGRQDWETYRRLFKIMLFSASIAGCVTLVAGTLAGPWIIALWTAHKVAITHASMLLFALSIAFQGVSSVGGIVLVSSNMHHLYNYLCLGGALAGLVLASATLPSFGFMAVPGSMVAQDLTLLLCAYFLCRHKLRHVVLGDFRTLLRSDYYWGKVQTLFSRAEY